MRKVIENTKRPWPLLFLSLLSLLGIGYFFFQIPPTSSFTFFGIFFMSLWLFFPLLFLFVYSLSGFIFTSSIQGLLIGLIICCFLGFRLTGLTNPLFTILLAILFMCIEGVLWKRKY